MLLVVDSARRASLQRDAHARGSLRTANVHAQDETSMPRVRNSCYPFDNLDVMRTVYCTKNNNAKSEERVEYDTPGRRYELIACAAYPRQGALISRASLDVDAHLFVVVLHPVDPFGW